MNPVDTSEQTPCRLITRVHKVVPRMHNDFLMTLFHTRPKYCSLISFPVCLHNSVYFGRWGNDSQMTAFRLTGTYWKSLAQHLFYLNENVSFKRMSCEGDLLAGAGMDGVLSGGAVDFTSMCVSACVLFTRILVSTSSALDVVPASV